MVRRTTQSASLSEAACWLKDGNNSCICRWTPWRRVIQSPPINRPVRKWKVLLAMAKKRSNIKLRRVFPDSSMLGYYSKLPRRMRNGQNFAFLPVLIHFGLAPTTRLNEFRKATGCAFTRHS